MEKDHLIAVRELVAMAPAGPRIEFGVHYGKSLKIIADHPDVTIGVDSFEGMGEPTQLDFDLGDRSSYPKGRLAVPMHKVAAEVPAADLIKGFVPAILGSLPLNFKFAFAHVDMDHYEPTKYALDWLWDKMLPGGIIACDDWFPDRNCLAALAIAEKAQERDFTGTSYRKAWWTF